MDICEYAEKVLDIRLSDYQKELLKKIDESYKENKPLRFILGSRGRSYSMILALSALAETYEKEESE